MQLQISYYHGCIRVEFRASGSDITMSLSRNDASLLGSVLESYAKNMPFEEDYMSLQGAVLHSAPPENGENGTG